MALCFRKAVQEKFGKLKIEENARTRVGAVKHPDSFGKNGLSEKENKEPGKHIDCVYWRALNFRYERRLKAGGLLRYHQ